MKRPEFKKVVSQFLRKRMTEWFNDKPLMMGLGISIVDANINKMDNLIQLFEDENGDIDIYGIIENMGTLKEPIKIDLQQISPILPNRVLLITQKDFDELLTYVE